MQFRYQLEPYSGLKSRHECPSCGKRGVFALYIDTETGMPIDETIGRCNREANCGYHKKPGEFFAENKRNTVIARAKRPKEAKARSNPLNNASMVESPLSSLRPNGLLHFVPSLSLRHFVRNDVTPPSFIPYEYFTPSLQGLESPNCFLQYLCTLFSRKRVEKAFMDYYIGTSKHWPGATVFWQIDKNANVRTGKAMLYDAATGHRVKQPFNHISWAHKLLDLQDFHLRQCLFGEHLLTNPAQKTAAIVESEKTALIASIFLPEYTWLATGGFSNLNADKCRVLRHCKRVILFPDVNGYDTWKQKSRELGLRMVHVSDMLEKKARPEQRKAGIDLADYLINQIQLKTT